MPIAKDLRKMRWAPLLFKEKLTKRHVSILDNVGRIQFPLSV